MDQMHHQKSRSTVVAKRDGGLMVPAPSLRAVTQRILRELRVGATNLRLERPFGGGKGSGRNPGSMLPSDVR